MLAIAWELKVVAASTVQARTGCEILTSVAQRIISSLASNHQTLYFDQFLQAPVEAYITALITLITFIKALITTLITALIAYIKAFITA